jgi:hypothetical protein
MMSRWVVTLAVIVLACGDNRNGADPSADADADGLSNETEGFESNVDSDGDGTPDWQDSDSDDDGIPDSVEAGDTNPVTPPRDTDDDGTPDFLDRDSDNDTIADAVETDDDFDEDGTPNHLDTDSDDDCIPDSVEARSAPPADSDGDGRADYLDRDADGDGVRDAQEDSDCDGATDPGETNPLEPDSDEDGATDLVETVLGTDPNDPMSNPEANGDIVFVEPFEQPQPPDQTLAFSTKVKSVDVYLLLDRSGTMSAQFTTIKNAFSGVVASLRCTAGDMTDCIPDVWAGAGRVGYSGGGGMPFVHDFDIQQDAEFSTMVGTEPGGCCSEPLVFSAYAAVTGVGSSGIAGISGTVAARSSCAGSPAANAAFETFGYPCFRNGSLPVVMLATDESPLDDLDANPNPNWDTVVKPAFASSGARFVGVTFGTSGQVPLDLRRMAGDTGVYNASNISHVIIAGGPMVNDLRLGVMTLVNNLRLRLGALVTDDTSDALDAVAEFIDHLETAQLGTAECTAGLLDSDTNADTFDDTFQNVRAGTPVCWKVVVKPNTTVAATGAPQLFHATITIVDGNAKFDERDLHFLVPPIDPR